MKTDLRRQTPPIRVAVMGTGRWGRNLVRVMRDAEDVELAWLIDPDDAALEMARATAPNAKAVSYIAHTGHDFDAAVVATPAGDHEAHVRDLIEKGKHVLVEKPATLFAATAGDLVRLARKRRVVLMVGHQMVFHPVFAALAAMTENREVGTLQRIAATRSACLDLEKEPGVLWSLGPHDISMIVSLVKQNPVNVACRIPDDAAPFKETMADIQLEFPGEIQADVTLLATAEKRIRTFTVHGTEGALVFDDAGPTATLLHRHGDGTVSSVAIANAEAEPLAVEFDHFVSAILNNKAPLTGGSHLRSVTKILESCTRGSKDAVPS